MAAYPEQIYGEMSPKEALESTPWLKNSKCDECYNFWQKGTFLYETPEGKLMIVQGCGCVPDYNLWVAQTRECIFEPLSRYSQKSTQLTKKEWEKRVQIIGKKIEESTIHVVYFDRARGEGFIKQEDCTTNLCRFRDIENPHAMRMQGFKNSNEAEVHLFELEHPQNP